MTAIILRIVIYAAIAWFVYAGIRRLMRDVKQQFQGDDAARAARRARDLNERARPDVIDLKRDSDGIFRPPGDKDGRR